MPHSGAAWGAFTHHMSRASLKYYVRAAGVNAIVCGGDSNSRPWGYESRRTAPTRLFLHINRINTGVAVGGDAFMCPMRNALRYGSRQNLGRSNSRLPSSKSVTVKELPSHDYAKLRRFTADLRADRRVRRRLRRHDRRPRGLGGSQTRPEIVPNFPVLLLDNLQLD